MAHHQPATTPSRLYDRHDERHDECHDERYDERYDERHDGRHDRIEFSYYSSVYDLSVMYYLLIIYRLFVI